jgi:hypothetical protein
VDYVPDILLSSRCPLETHRCVSVKPLWHEDGDLIGLDLAFHHLPRLDLDPNRIHISAAFVTVQVRLKAQPAESFAPHEVRGAVKTAVKNLFLPGEPDGANAREVSVDAMRASVEGLAEIGKVLDIELESDPAHELRNAAGEVTGVRLREKELADVQISVVLV